MTNLPSLLYASPFPPQRSGISSYSRILVQALSRRFEVTLLSGGFNGEEAGLGGQFPTIRYGTDSQDFSAFDHVLYNVGNNLRYHAFIYEAFLAHPAPIILHDVVLYYLTVGYYQEHPDFYSQIYRLGGSEALATIKDARKAGLDLQYLPGAHRHPLNGEFLQRAPQVFVHSQDARRRIHPSCRGSVHCIPMLDPGREAGNSCYLGERHKIPDDALVIASFGIIADTKQNDVVCKALPLLQESNSRPIYYVMAGEGSHADSFLGPRIIKTGYLDDEDFNSVLARCDAVVNLRYPSMGETSIGLIQAMGAGKPCVVSDFAWFAELPDDVVLKIPHQDPVQEVVDTLRPLFSGSADLQQLGARARAHIQRHHTAARSADAIAGALLSKTPSG